MIKPTYHNNRCARLQLSTGIHRSILARCGVRDSDSPATAKETMRRALGDEILELALTMGVAGSYPMLAAAVKRVEDAPSPDEAPDDDEVQDTDTCTCHHKAAIHEDLTGPCKVKDCTCTEFEDAGDEPEAQEEEPIEEPEKEAMARRIAASTGRPLEQVRAAARSCSANARPALVRTGFTPAAIESTRRRAPTTTKPSADVTASDRRIAEQHGYDPEKVARSRRALGLK